MANSIWQLYRTDDVGEWVLMATFESLAATAKRIIDVEGIPVKGLFFELHVDVGTPSDDAVLGHLEYRGKHASYVLKRQSH